MHDPYNDLGEPTSQNVLADTTPESRVSSSSIGPVSMNSFYSTYQRPVLENWPEFHSKYCPIYLDVLKDKHKPINHQLNHLLHCEAVLEPSYHEEIIHASVCSILC